MKKICILLFVILLAMLLSPIVYAEEEDFLKDQYEALGVEELLDVVDDDTLAMLDELGINQIDFNSLFNTSPKKVFGLVIDIITGKATSPIKILMTVFVIIIFFSIVESMIPESEKINLAMNTASALICVTVLAKPIFEAVSRGMTAVDMSSKLMLVFVPIFVAVVSVSGNPMTAVSYNSLMLAAAQVVSHVANLLIKPFVAIFFALGLTSSIAPDFNFNALAAEIKKTATIILSFIASMFFTLLSLKSILGNASDSVGTRGIKFILSSFIPVVGGALSEGYSSLVGSLSLMKGVVGSFGITVLVLINFPVVVELLIWSLSMRLASAVAATTKLNSLSGLFKTVADSTTLINVVVILNCFILIVSTGLVMLLKGGAA